MKKIISLLLSLLCAFGIMSFVGCGGSDEPKAEDFTGITLTGATVEYDGEFHKLEVSGTLPAGTTVVYKYNGTISENNQGVKDAGTYSVTAKLTCSGYNDKTLSATLTINGEGSEEPENPNPPAGSNDFSGVTLPDATVDFDGEFHKLEVSGTLPAGTTVVYKYNGTVSENNQGVREASCTPDDMDGNSAYYKVSVTLTCAGYDSKTIEAKLYIVNRQTGADPDVAIDSASVGYKEDNGDLYYVELTGSDVSAQDAEITYWYDGVLDEDNSGVSSAGRHTVEVVVKIPEKNIIILSGAIIIGEASSEDTSQELNIWIKNAGYGVQWLEDVISLFKQQDWVKEKYPELSFAALNTDGGASDGLDQIASGKCSYDIVFPVGGFTSETYLNNYQMFEDLNDGVYETKVPGEDVYIKDKMVESVYKDTEVYVANEGYFRFGVPWVQGCYGFIYNLTTIQATLNDSKYDINAETGGVRTTDEFFALLGRLLNNQQDTQCLLFYSSTICSYFTGLADIWWAQYDGVESYEKLVFNGAYISESGETITGSGSLDAETGFGSRGRLESLKLIQTLFSPTSSDNKYLGPWNTTWSATSFSESQQALVTGSGAKYCFAFSGDWFDNETKSFQTSGQQLGVMKTPVSSVAGFELGFESDKDLSEAIYYIDQGYSFEEIDNAYNPQHDTEMDEEMYERLREMRNITVPSGYSAYIPSYSDAKKLAKDFLRFLSTDIAIEAVLKANGTCGIYQYDAKTKSPEAYKALSDIMKDFYDIRTESVASGANLRAKSASPLVYYGNLSTWSITPHIAQYFVNGSTSIDVNNVFAGCFYDNDSFSLMLTKAGLK